MKLLTSIKCCSICLLALAACSKKGNPGVTSVNGDTTVTVIAQKDPTIANSEGFFLNDWAPKTFVAPAYSTVAAPSGNATVTINVDYSTVITKVPKYLFGNNAGAFVPQLTTSTSLINSIKNLSPNILRFPGGSISDVYFWDGVVPTDVPDSLFDSSGNPAPVSYWYGSNTPAWELSLANYYTALQQTGSTGIITINYGYARYGTSAHPDQVAAHLAANWVRHDNGRTKYWEIGNEDYGAWEDGYKINISKNKDGQPAIITGALYGQHFKIFADSMRAAASEVGAQIKIGALLNGTAPASWNTVGLTWEQGYFASAGNSADFYIVHDYFTGTDNETAAVILNTAATESAAVISYMNATTTKNGVSLKPIALTEWNIFATGSRQMVSNVAGMHADLVLGELLKNQFGMASRWDLINGWGTTGDDLGMFSSGEPSVTDNTPQPVFYHMYYFQKYFGDRMIKSTVQNSSAVLTQNIGDIVAYASSFTSGEAGVVIVNKGTASQTVSVNITNFVPGTRYYYYTLVGGTDNGEFSQKVYINGNGPDISTVGGPSGYQTLAAVSSSLTGGIKVSVPPRSVIFLVAEGKK